MEMKSVIKSEGKNAIIASYRRKSEQIFCSDVEGAQNSFERFLIYDKCDDLCANKDYEKNNEKRSAGSQGRCQNPGNGRRGCSGKG